MWTNGFRDIVSGMSRTVPCLAALLLMVAGCAQQPAADTVTEAKSSATPLPTRAPDGSIIIRDTGTGITPVCGLVSPQRIGEIFGITGVEARESGMPENGNHVGTCEYTAESFRLTLAIHARDITLSPAEFVQGATYEKGRTIDGLGDAAALATFDDSIPELDGFARLVVAQDILTLILTGPGENADGFPEVAREALPGVASL